MYYIGILQVVPRRDNCSSTVYSLLLVETLQTALTGADLYYWFVSGFGNLDHLTSPYVSAFDVPIIGSLVSFTVQLFFVYRIWILSGRSSWLLCLVICLVSRSYRSRAHTSPSYFQFSTVNAVAAFYGGVYVSLVCPELFPIRLTSGRPTFTRSSLVAGC